VSASPEPESTSLARRVADIVVAVCLCGGMLAPLAKRLVTGAGDEASVQAERRVAAAHPELEWTLAALEGFPADYEAWLSDAFAFRRTLLRWHNALLLIWLGAAPNERLLVGPDRWIFLRDDGALDSWRGVRPFTPRELEQWRIVLERRHDWCAARGIEYLFVVAPNKHSIYPEELPGALASLSERRRVQQLVEELGQNSRVDAIALEQALRAAKDDPRNQGHPLYFPLGTHWNSIGAYWGYVALAEHLAPRFPSLAPKPFEAFELVDMAHLPNWGDSWAPQLHIGDLLRQPLWELELRGPRQAQLNPQSIRRARHGILDGIAVQPDLSLPRMVLFRDSFSTALWPFLAEHLALLATETDDKFDPALIERLGADIVLWEKIERTLESAPPTTRLEDAEVMSARGWLATTREVGPAGEEQAWSGWLRLELARPGPALVHVDGEPIELPEGRRFAFVRLEDQRGAPLVEADQGVVLKRVDLRAD